MSFKKVPTLEDVKTFFSTGTDVWRGRLKNEKDKLEVIIMSDKVNQHYIDFFDSKQEYTIEIDRTTYYIRKDSLYKTELTIKEKFLSLLRIRKINKKFMIFFEKDNMEPKIIDTIEPKINSKIVFIAINAKVTTKGIASLFKEGFNLPLNAKTMLMVAIIVIVGVVAFFGYQQGWFRNLKI